MKQIRRVLTLGTLLAVVLSACASLASCQNATPPAETESEFYTTEAATDPATEPETEPETETETAAETEAEPQSLKYKLRPDGAYEIVGIGNWTDPELVIPSEHEGLPVVDIDSEAFRGATHLTSITIPNWDTTTIQWGWLLRDCVALTELIATEDNPYAASFDGALYDKGLTKLLFCPAAKTSIAFPDSMTAVDHYAFAQNVGLQSLTIPDGVTSIGSRVFAWAGMSSITLPDSLTEIGDAFWHCPNLTEIRIPEGVQELPRSMFEGCSSLVRVTLPARMTEIAHLAFSNCTSLTEIRLPDGITNIGEFLFSGCTSLTEVVIPGSVTAIIDNAFKNCTSLTEVTIPDGVTRIYSYAFQACTSLSSVVLPKTLTLIEDYVFWECSALTDIYYAGTEEEWNAIEKGERWDLEAGAYTVHFNCDLQ